MYIATYTNLLFTDYMKKLLAVVLVTAAGSCFASLNGVPSDTGRKAVVMSQKSASSAAAPYKDLQKTLDSGTIVHEYVGNDGVVFAVSWKGPYMPDLKDILGTHFNTLVSESRKQRGHPQMIIKHSDVVIISSGHMGAFEGKAYLPAKLPAGFTANDVK